MQRLSEETFSNLGFKAHDKILNLQLLVDGLFESAKQIEAVHVQISKEMESEISPSC